MRILPYISDALQSRLPRLSDLSESISRWKQERKMTEHEVRDTRWRAALESVPNSEARILGSDTSRPSRLDFFRAASSFKSAFAMYHRGSPEDGASLGFHDFKNLQDLKNGWNRVLLLADKHNMVNQPLRWATQSHEEAQDFFPQDIRDWQLAMVRGYQNKLDATVKLDAFSDTPDLAQQLREKAQSTGEQLRTSSFSVQKSNNIRDEKRVPNSSIDFTPAPGM